MAGTLEPCQRGTGRATRAVAGGYDALAEMVFAGFDSLQALSTTTPRPFDANRDGLALGEGAGVVTLERYEDAVQRGADIIAEICGYGAATDLHPRSASSPLKTTPSSVCRSFATAGLRS